MSVPNTSNDMSLGTSKPSAVATMAVPRLLRRYTFSHPPGPRGSGWFARCVGEHCDPRRQPSHMPVRHLAGIYAEQAETAGVGGDQKADHLVEDRHGLDAAFTPRHAGRRKASVEHLHHAQKLL